MDGVERLMGRGWTMMLQGNRDAQIEAAGLFRRAVELAPDYADGWGSLGFVYAYSSHYYPAEEREARRDRARAAATRAQIGRASRRERVCQSVLVSVVAGSLKKKNTTHTKREERNYDK